MGKRGKIHFVYFCCGEHYRRLYVSLYSIAALGSEIAGKIYVYFDPDDPPSEAEEKALYGITGLEVITKRTEKSMSWGGYDVICNELKAFGEIAGEMSREDYLAKTDADVLFVSDHILRKVVRSGADFIGKKEDTWAPVIYSQGGCYFLKGSLLSGLGVMDRVESEALLERLNTAIKRSGHKEKEECPEDLAIFDIVRRKTDRIRFADYYVPMRLTNDSRLLRCFGRSVVHFRWREEEMEDVLRKSRCTWKEYTSGLVCRMRKRAGNIMNSL